jgi:hypothetical protein
LFPLLRNLGAWSTPKHSAYPDDKNQPQDYLRKSPVLLR